MKFKLMLAVVLACLFYSCQKPALDTILFENSFENQNELNEFVLNSGEISISEMDALDSEGCLHVYVRCETPNLYQEFGPFENDYFIHIESWIKTERGADLHLNLKEKVTEYVRIEVKNRELKWEKYRSEKLFVPQGESVMLYIDASNGSKSHSYFDDIKLIASEEP